MKNQRIRVLNDADKNALRMLAHFGDAATASLKTVGLSPTRIENMCRDKLIVAIDKEQKYQHKNDNAIWALTKKGKEFVKANLAIDKCACGTNAIKHNTAVAKQYSEILKRNNVKEILTENEVRQYIKDSSKLKENSKWKKRFDTGKMSMPDLTVVTTSGTIECIEVITNNYGAEEIQAKEATVEFLEAEYKTIRI